MASATSAWLISALAAFAVFATCCVILAIFGHRITDETSAQILLIPTAISMFAWPVLLARAYQHHRNSPKK